MNESKRRAIERLARDPECGPIVKYYRDLLLELLQEIDRVEWLLYMDKE